MEEVYHDYLSLMGELSSDLARLSDLAQQKINAVHNNDLIALDEVLKMEQAMSLSLRCLEQRRQKLLAQLGGEGVPLGELPSQYPAELRPQAKETVETLRQSYQIYRSAAESARITLECNLHQLEKAVADMGGSAGNAGYHAAGYGSVNVEPPKNMKTDFRA